MRYISISSVLPVFLAMSFVLAVPAAAQDYVAQPGQAEVSGFTGLAMIGDGVGNHPLFGGGLFVHASKYLSVGGDFAYASMNNSSYGFGVTSDTKYYAFLGKVRVHVPTESRVQPYVNGAIGALRGSGSVRVGGSSVFDMADTELGYGGGGGLNIFATRRFGVRFELNYLRAHGGGNSGDLLIGAFYRFGGE